MKGLNVFRENRIIKAVLYNTVIVKIDPEDCVTLNTGGWYTKHTKKAMNKVLSDYGIKAHIYQKDFKWYLHLNGKDHLFETDVLTFGGTYLGLDIAS